MGVEASVLLPWNPAEDPPPRGEEVTEDNAPIPKAGTAEPRRVITDLEGRRWTVFESAATYDRRITALVFDSTDIMRRVRNYPAGWFDLSDEALLELSTHA
jgi:hypothetical protein